MNAALNAIAAKMSPDHNTATLAVVDGDESTATLHASRREIARFTDRIVGRSRGTMSPGRKRLIDQGREAYDGIAAELDTRGEL